MFKIIQSDTAMPSILHVHFTTSQERSRGRFQERPGTHLVDGMLI